MSEQELELEAAPEEGGEVEEGSGAEQILEPGTGEVAPESQGAIPEPITREMLDEALSGVAGQYQDRIDALGQQMQQLQQFLMYQRQSQTKPQTQQQHQGVVPEFDRFAEMRPQDAHRLLKQLEERIQATERAATQRYEQLTQREKQKDQAERYYQYLYNETETAAKSDPMFQDPAARDFLEKQIVAHIQASGGNLQKVNIPQIAKKTVEFIQKMADSKVKEKMSASPGPPRPPSGSAAKPGKPPLNVTSLDDFDKAFDANAADFENDMKRMLGVPIEQE
ncbi:MAG: hypothetical protein R6U98_06620 [Pirellulaceae bacterium]